MAARAADTPATDPALLRKQNALRLIWKEGEEAAADSPARAKLREEFLTESAVFVKTYPSSAPIWTLRATAALELKRPREAWEAGRKMIELGLDKSENALIQDTLTRLERLKWLGEQPPAGTPTSTPTAPTAKGAPAPAPKPDSATEAENRLALAELQQIAKELGAPANAQKLGPIRQEFLTKSAAYLKRDPDNLRVWTLRGLVALDAGDAAVTEAEKQVVALLKAGQQDAKAEEFVTLYRRRSVAKDASKDAPFINSLGMKFVPVPGTEVLFSVWLTRVQDFEAFVKETGHNATEGMFSFRTNEWKRRGDSWKSPGFTQSPQHPVCGVSWDDAQAFAQWLTGKERGAGMLKAGQSYRLPQDWEWSVAAGLSEPRDGTPGAKDMKIPNVYPWGTQWPPPNGAGNYAGEEVRGADWAPNRGYIENYRDGYARTSPVGSFGANAFGLYDMGGNLRQWCEDFYVETQTSRALRGSSWFNAISQALWLSDRSSSAPTDRTGFSGFRLVIVMSVHP